MDVNCLNQAETVAMDLSKTAENLLKKLKEQKLAHKLHKAEIAHMNHHHKQAMTSLWLDETDHQASKLLVDLPPMMVMQPQDELDFYFLKQGAPEPSSNDKKMVDDIPALPELGPVAELMQFTEAQNELDSYFSHQAPPPTSDSKVLEQRLTDCMQRVVDAEGALRASEAEREKQEWQLEVCTMEVAQLREAPECRGQQLQRVHSRVCQLEADVDILQEERDQVKVHLGQLAEANCRLQLQQQKSAQERGALRSASSRQEYDVPEDWWRQQLASSEANTSWEDLKIQMTELLPSPATEAPAPATPTPPTPATTTPTPATRAPATPALATPAPLAPARAPSAAVPVAVEREPAARQATAEKWAAVAVAPPSAALLDDQNSDVLPIASTQLATGGSASSMAHPQFLPLPDLAEPAAYISLNSCPISGSQPSTQDAASRLEATEPDASFPGCLPALPAAVKALSALAASVVAAFRKRRKQNGLQQQRRQQQQPECKQQKQRHEKRQQQQKVVQQQAEWQQQTQTVQQWRQRRKDSASSIGWLEASVDYLVPTGRDVADCDQPDDQQIVQLI